LRAVQELDAGAAQLLRIPQAAQAPVVVMHVMTELVPTATWAG
jgi:hypothetical protein